MHRLLTGVRPYVALVLLCLGLYVPGQAAVSPLDRDESRYMQASRQMLESHDFVAIHFQDTPRNKKPVGIYWAQAAAVAAFSDAESNATWPYRLPSLLGATAAVLLTFAFGASLFDRRIAFTGAAFLASSLILVAEAHQAKTDAALLACVTAVMGILGRLYMQARKGPAVPAWQVAALWLALGVGMLIKGPIPPMVMILTLITLALADRRWRWLSTLRPITGIPIALAVVLPWLVAVATGPQTGFVSDAVQKDLLPKLIGGQEAHGGFPGLYAAIAIATLWPGSLFLFPALVRSVRERAQPGVRFCLAWVLPSWLVFEIVPTKLPHYPLPVYPALCLLIAAALFAVREDAFALFSRWWARALGGIWGVIGVTLAAASVALPMVYGDGFSWTSVPLAAIALGASAAPYVHLWRGRPFPAAALAVALSVPVYAGVFQVVLPTLSHLWVAPRLADAVKAVAPEGGMTVALSGYHEPSAVFLLGTATRLVGAATVAETIIADPTTTIGIVESRDVDTFTTRLTALGVSPPPPRAEVEGFNYSKGKPVRLFLYRLSDGP
ncbi:MAG: glycosyltransferase family 39 protein [Rhodospirillaceae bacterium]|nr:glycosyltransferase family 39 protein [Rhodospirillaceae bacterium]